MKRKNFNISHAKSIIIYKLGANDFAYMQKQPFIALRSKHQHVLSCTKLIMTALKLLQIDRDRTFFHMIFHQTKLAVNAH